MSHDALGDRMKGYEYVTRTYLTRRTPAIIRIDGKAFHTFTRGFDKPYDKLLMEAMQETMVYLCKNIQGCVFGYTQSDEITLVLTDYAKLTTDAWFGYNIQKCASVAASMATMYFNKVFTEIADAEINAIMYLQDMDVDHKRLKVLDRARGQGAMFDARIFSIPKEEVCNCLIWRQQDAIRNSIESAGRTYFSDKQLFKKNCKEIQDMLLQEYNVDWNDYPSSFKHGTACFKGTEEVPIIGLDGTKEKVNRTTWMIDEDTPIFTQDRGYVERWL